MNSFDARVRYTRMVIEEAFLSLLQQRKASKITVTEICQKAGLNRATFYKHYLDVPDLLEQIENDLFARIRESFSREDVKLQSFLIQMMNFTKENPARFMALGSDNGDPNLMTKTFLVCYENAYPLMAKSMTMLPENERQMLYAYVSHGSGAVLTWWIKNGMTEPPEQVAQFILDLCSVTVDTLKQEGWRNRYQKQ